MKRLPLNDEIAVAISQVVDDALAITRKPSYADLDNIILRNKVDKGDPKLNGQNANVGKAKRVNAALNWALEYDQEAGETFVSSLLSLIRGHGGFRGDSPNFVGHDSIRNLQSSLKAEGIVLSSDGMVTPIVLDNLSDLELEKALMSYIRRAKKGASDAALLTGTSKDLLEAVAAHVISRIKVEYRQSNFPTLLGFAFYLLGLSTPEIKGENKVTARFEISMYELGCSVNNLRNKQGTGHGRPFLPTITDTEAKAAIESMGLVSEFLLNKLKEKIWYKGG
ncbi:abortive infection family protein [Staphylococcus chromogenes]|uniref:abortive infection family protein n=1 Tax=Staphylococcus chromogenes TaxID=46126 RepID=UPI002887F3D1|nr:abortive infection family protein [Staphylococcus chromogenes]MDT0670815.1 abortive infection family protein [Staphylococcus chromogenes]MDT0673007.1 abortive infection family protein [Staphylococcus chromogenes]